MEPSSRVAASMEGTSEAGLRGWGRRRRRPLGYATIDARDMYPGGSSRWSPAVRSCDGGAVGADDDLP